MLLIGSVEGARDVLPRIRGVVIFFFFFVGGWVDRDLGMWLGSSWMFLLFIEMRNVL